MGYRLPNPSYVGLAGVPSFVPAVGFRTPFPTFIGTVGTVGTTPPVEPPVDQPVGGGRTTGIRPTQFGRIRPFEERDEYGRLVARQGQAGTRRGAIQALHEEDKFGALAARSIIRASLSGAHADEVTSASARRGLPSKELLIVFLNAIERES